MASDQVLPQVRHQPAPSHHSLQVAPGGMKYEEFRAMGTTVALILPEDQFDFGFKLTRQLFQDWEETLSRFLPGSELSRLNAQAGTPVEVSPLLFRVLYAAWLAAQETEGLFDPTLLNQLVDIGYDRSFDTLPKTLAKSTRAARPGGNWREMRLNHRKRSVTLPAGVSVEVGGIAKGMAVDAALEQLKEQGIDNAVVNAGGDLAVTGLPPEEDAWPLSVMGKDTTWVIPFTYGALATSGINKRHWQQGDRSRHHILDPRSGESAESGLWSVTVAAGSCQGAEVAAKAAFLLGAQQGSNYLSDHGLSGMLIRTDGSWTSAGVWPTALMKTLE